MKKSYKKFYQYRIIKEKEKELEEARKYTKATSEMINEFNRTNKKSSDK